jgi:hypothetical protein
MVSPLCCDKQTPSPDRDFPDFLSGLLHGVAGMAKEREMFPDAGRLVVNNSV